MLRAGVWEGKELDKRSSVELLQVDDFLVKNKDEGIGLPPTTIYVLTTLAGDTIVGPDGAAIEFQDDELVVCHLWTSFGPSACVQHDTHQ